MSDARNMRRSTRMSTFLDESELNSTAEDDMHEQTSKTPSKPSQEATSSEATTSRSGRKLKPTKKLLELKNKDVMKIKRKLDELSISLSEESDDNGFEREAIRAQELFHEDDVEGQNMYSFKTPKKKQGMALLATNTPKSAPRHSSPSTPKTPKTPKSRQTLLAKTPHRDRENLKKCIAKQVVMDDSDDDFSASESDDFEPSGSSSSSDQSGSSEEDQPSKPPPRTPSATPSSSGASIAFGARRSTRRTANKNLDYVLESDAYFNTHASSKTVTSNHTLDRLKNPRLSQDRLFGLLAELKLSTEHERAIKKLHEEYFSFFPKWMLILNEGFSVLLHGVGSKRGILTEFRERMLHNQTVVVINGFFPSLTIKDVLDAITNDVLETTISNSNYHEVVDEIDTEFQSQPDLHLFLIVHNIDGVMLRNNKAQHILSRLAKVKNIHLLASIDHINTPLLWDNTKLSNYNFSWWDVTTMLPYTAETAFENSLLIQNSGALALSSMKNVFLSLTSNSRGIYLLIVKHQMANKGNPNYQGMPFKDLYWGCRESFLVSSDLALRAQLTEFLDHKLVKMKRTADGIEHLKIPIELTLLQQFLDEQQQ